MTIDRTSRADFVALFSAQVEAHPDRVAVRTPTTEMTYRELDQWSGRVAARLAGQRLGPGSVVALATDRESAVVGVLAVLRIGAGYVGIDETLPVRRQLRLIEETAADGILATAGFHRLRESGLPLVDLIHYGDGALYTVPDRAADPESRVFHIVFTSGTTGAPKGVRISYRSVFNRLSWMWRDHPFDEDSIIAVQKSVALVASPWEILGGLLRGITSVVLTREQVLDPSLFAEKIEKERITHLYLTPQVIVSLLDEVERRGGMDHQPTLVTSGADTLPVATVRRFHQVLPHTRLLNLYGMTETSSNVAAYDTSGLAPDAERVPVGTPVAGAEISIRDRFGRRLPPQVTGEVWIAGTPLALSYLRDDDQGKFVTTADGVRCYRTGDRGRLSADGALEIVGRQDNQVKIRGYRVELEEIEATLRYHPAVLDAGVYVAEEQHERRLVACATVSDETAPAVLRAYLRERLPDYLVPARVVILPLLPLGTNGKLDRRTLATLADAARTEDSRPRFSPENETEWVVSGLWRELLGSAASTAEDNFFDAGGHSLLAVRFANRLKKAFGRDITVRELVSAPTLGAIIELCSPR